MSAQLPEIGKITADIFDEMIYPRLGRPNPHILVGPQQDEPARVERFGDQRIAEARATEVAHRCREPRQPEALGSAQIVGASIVAAFVVIGALGAAVQGSVAARDWACRLGWTTQHCTVPSGPLRSDIPA